MTPSTGADTFGVQLSKGKWWWTARVVRIGYGRPEHAQGFRALNRDRALARAERWCYRHRRKWLNPTENVTVAVEELSA